jgi:hypothetical protein
MKKRSGKVAPCVTSHGEKTRDDQDAGEKERKRERKTESGEDGLVCVPGGLALPSSALEASLGPTLPPCGGHKHGEKVSVNQVFAQRPHQPVDIYNTKTNAHDFPLPRERKKTLFRQATFASTPTTLTPTLLGPSTRFPLQGPCDASTSSDFCTWTFCVCLFVYLIEDPAEHL